MKIFFRGLFSAFVYFFVLSISLRAQISDESWKVYDDSSMARVDITLEPSRLVWIYQNPQSDSLHPAKVRFRNRYIDESVDSVGFRLRGNTSRNAKKKSFKVEFNGFIKGTRFYGLKDLNLNGEHNDPSIIRSKLSFNHFLAAGAIAGRASHCEVYINGTYYGLYISVENIDDSFIKRNLENYTGNLWKCLYPADLKYLGENPQTYINLNDNGRPAYELKTNEDAMDFSKLVRFIRVLNNTPDNALADSLESIIKVSDVLRYYALNVLLGNWDSYWPLMNNYYLYHDPMSDIIRFLPYDCDNTFGIDWFNTNWATANPYSYPKVVSGSRPLAERVLANAQYKNLYTRFLSFYNTKLYPLSSWESEIDRLRQMITGAALADTFRIKDYGFTPNDFFNSYSSGSYNNQHVKFGLKQFVNTRNASLPAQLSYADAKPLAYDIRVSPRAPRSGDSIRVTVAAFSNSSLSQVVAQYSVGSGSVENYQMSFVPLASSKNVADADRYVCTLPPLGPAGTGKIRIYLKDGVNRELLYPRKGPIEIKSPAVVTGLLINEFLADNVNSTPDPSGDHDDWVELFNPSDSAVLLTGKYLTDDKANLRKWRFAAPGLYLQSKGRIVIWCDEQASQPGLHANFKLSKSGEFIAITDSSGTAVIDSLTFGAQLTDISYGRYPDGGANWRELTPTPGAANVPNGIENEDMKPGFILLENYPNPFNPVTTIRFQVNSRQSIVNSQQSSGDNRMQVSLKVFDILGREVATLVNEAKPAGSYTVSFNASSFSSGTYFCELRAGEFRIVRKVILLK